LKRFSLLAAAALLVVNACVVAPGPPRRTDATFAQVEQGMTRDEVMAIAGPPDNTMPFPMSRTDSWGYFYWDDFGYFCEQSVTFGPDGLVLSKISRRVNEGRGRD
jgi:hypothetical protein